MTTVVIQEPSTRTHHFTAMSAQGRRLRISVEANRDMTSEAVLADVAASLAPATKTSLKEEEIGNAQVFGALIGLRVIALVLGGFALLLAELAGFDLLGMYAYKLPSDWPEFVAHQSIGNALLRCHLILLGVILVGAVICALWPKK